MITKKEIALVRSLSDKSARDEHGLFVVEGRKPVAELMDSGLVVEAVYGTEEFEGIPGLVAVGMETIRRMSSLRSPQGIIAVARKPVFDCTRQAGAKLGLALDSVQDPGNLGTIVRTAEWFGLTEIYCSPDTADCWNPKAIQASMGSVFRARIFYGDIAAVLSELEPSGIPVYGTFMDGDPVSSARIPDPGRGMIVMGNEGNGISDRIAALCTGRLSVPGHGLGSRPESLNVSAAAAVILYEFRRRSAAQ